MQRSDFTLMAPVGSRESLFAAIAAGADAVYFGVENLNMRAHSAKAFTIDDLHEIAAICHEHGIESYLTVNTIIYDEERPLMKKIIDAAKAAGIDAVIASDVAVMSYCREVGQEVHLSTQLNISNIEALRFYAQFADVVVLARELTLKQVKAIADAIEAENICGPAGRPVRIEMFCHGALCMAVSGKCYLSLSTRGYSANRGACIQTCRRSYIAKDKERDIEFEIDNEYIMSPKDLKTIGFLDRMVKAGVRVFKIEGRARGPEYVRAVVECYDEALKAIAENRWNEQVSQSWDAKLASVFNRGFWDGFYLGAPVGELTQHYGSQATEKKIYVGKCLKYFAKAQVAEFLVQAQDFSLGEKLLITGPTTGAIYVTPEEILEDGTKLTEIKKGMDITFKIAEKVRENDKLYVVRAVKPEEEI
jgi:putative protease